MTILKPVLIGAVSVSAVILAGMSGTFSPVQAGTTRAVPAAKSQHNAETGLNPARLAARLKSSDEKTRYEAAIGALQVQPEQARVLVLPLAKATSDQSMRVQTAAIQALAHIGPTAAAAVPALEQILLQAQPSSGDGQWQAASSSSIAQAIPAVRALGAIGKPAHGAAMVVSDCLLNNSLLHERHVVLETLFAIGADPACAHAILTVARQEGKGTQTRHLALAVLGAIRPVPAEALPFLQELGQDTQDPVAKEKANQILKAAAEHGTSTTAPKASPVHYRHVFAANDTDQILAALDELGERRATATQLIPSLVRLSTHAHGPVREKALEVLSDLGASAQTASPALMENGLREQDPHKRLAVFHAIQMIDPQGTSAGPSAALALDDPFKAANAIQLLEMYGNTSYAPAVEVAKKRWRLR